MATPDAQHALDVARRRRKGPDSPGIAATSLNDDRNSKLRTSEGSEAPSNSGGRGISVLDILRILGGAVLLSSALSFFVTGDSILWGFRPWYTRPDQILRWLQGPINLTDEELKAYDGSVEGKPIYVGLNGSIYDVTAGKRVYGPGGSYNFFAGRDATRAFVTGCFEDDLTPDMRGVEEMYVPIDADPEPSAATSAEVEQGDELKRAGGRTGVKKSELKTRREREYRLARKQVHNTIAGWAQVFSGAKGKPYFKVGEIIREPGWLEKLPRRELCEAAAKQRPKRNAKSAGK